MGDALTAADVPAFLRALFDRAVAVADPMKVIPAALPPKPSGRVVVIGAGKASARMAEAVEACWDLKTRDDCEGLVITRYGHGRPCRCIEIVEAAHPVPDQAGFAATRRIMDLVASLGPDDFVLTLLSGGASALLTAPVAGVTFEDKQKLHQNLLASGAPIGTMNIIRKQVSAVKGGRLAALAHPAKMLALMISDVPGDDPADIGSGPTVGDLSSAQDALKILAEWQMDVPASISVDLQAERPAIAPDDPRLKTAENRVIIAPSQSLWAAKVLAEDRGCQVRLLGDEIEGEARDVAAQHAALARRYQQVRQMAGDPDRRPLILLSGGELTVTKRGDGTGGPNAEYALALALALDGAEGIYAISCDTDGVDGSAEIAGALISPETLAKAARCGQSAKIDLATNNAHGFFEPLGDQIITGPTLTNVNDFRAILIL